MASQEKIDRKVLRSPDAVQEQLGAFSQYAQENSSQVAIGIGGLLVLAVLTSLGMGYVSHSRDATASSFARAVANIEYDSPSAAVVGLTSLAESGSGTYSDLAVLYRARVQSQEGNFEAALTDYETAAQSAPTDYLKQAALVGKGFALAELGKSEEALAAYGEAAEDDGPYRAEALDSRARLAEQLGKKDVAIASLRSLLELDLGPQRRQDVDKRLQGLEAS